jgi:8-oxo-dGTP pyrophosphatase MutT (NUDIX family)
MSSKSSSTESKKSPNKSVVSPSSSVRSTSSSSKSTSSPSSSKSFVSPSSPNKSVSPSSPTKSFVSPSSPTKNVLPSSSTKSFVLPSSPTKSFVSPSSPTKNVSPSSATKNVSPSSPKSKKSTIKNTLSNILNNKQSVDLDLVDNFILSEFDKAGLPKLIADLQYKMEKVKKITIPDYEKNTSISTFLEQIDNYIKIIRIIRETNLVKKENTIKLVYDINEKLTNFQKKFSNNLNLFLMVKTNLENKTFDFEDYPIIDEKDLTDFYYLFFSSNRKHLQENVELYLSNNATKDENSFSNYYKFGKHLKPRTVWKAICSPKFQIWQQRMAEQSHLTIKHILITDIDMFGPVNVGFIKFKTFFVDDRNKTTKDGKENIQMGIVFMRGDSVAILVLLHEIDKKKKINQLHVVLTCQNRIPAGDQNFVELVARMVDSSTNNVIGVAAKEVEEETGIKINIKDTIDLGMMAPSMGGCDERMHMYAFVQKVTSEQINKYEGKLTGNLEEGESITLKVVKYEEVMQHTYDAKAMCAMFKYEQYLRSQEESE